MTNNVDHDLTATLVLVLGYTIWADICVLQGYDSSIEAWISADLGSDFDILWYMQIQRET